MSDAENSVGSRGFTTVDASRAFISLLILAIVSVCIWFALPALQSLILPSVPGGRHGPWVVRPILAFHYGAVVVMTAATFPLITRPLWKVWTREDAELGTRYDPFQGRPLKRTRLMVKALMRLVLYAAALLFYLFSWDIIGPDGIVEHLPWATLNHSYQDISSLETIPNGQRSESISQDGPWYSVKFKGGRSLTLSDDNEGTTLEELSAMTAFIAERSGLVWTRRSDARRR